MIDPTDDDERTNSLGLFNTAEAFRLSAMALATLEGIRNGVGTILRSNRVPVRLAD
jgi:hypothetical protein